MIRSRSEVEVEPPLLRYGKRESVIRIAHIADIRHLGLTSHSRSDTVAARNQLGRVRRSWSTIIILTAFAVILTANDVGVEMWIRQRRYRYGGSITRLTGMYVATSRKNLFCSWLPPYWTLGQPNVMPFSEAHVGGDYDG